MDGKSFPGVSLMTIASSKGKWAEQEFSNVDLGDLRLNKRLIQIAESFSESPESPINQACETWAGAKAAYRFFQNENVSAESILKSHVQNVAGRIKKENLVLVAQDTSYFLYSSHPSVQGMGRVNGFKSKSTSKTLKTSGIVMHTAFAMTSDGLPLGLLYQKIFTRDDSVETTYNSQLSGHNSQIPIEEKESFKWLEALEESHKYRTESTRMVTICDREADIYDLFYRADELGASLLVRAKTDRYLGIPTRSKKNPSERLWESVGRQKSAGTWEVDIPVKDNEDKRTAILTVRFAAVQLYPTRHHPNYQKLEPPLTQLYAVYVKEENPPLTVKEPLEWMLLTNIPVHSYDEAIEKVKWYCLRWRIETFHKILKSGFKVEDCRLGTADRLIRYLGVMSVIAWRMFWITLVNRSSPEQPCNSVLSEEEWRALYAKINHTKIPPSEIPSLGRAIRWIAQLGGFLGRKGDGDPGIITLWRGWKRLADLADGWSYATA